MIRAEGLVKNYGPLRAVDGISFSVQPGEVLGFLGPNGAGKTTTMRMLAGFVPASAGHAEICGFRIDTQPLEAKRRLGYLPEGAPAYGEMAPGEFLHFVGRIRGLGGSALGKRIDEVSARLQLGPVMKQPIETLSKGFRRRVGLAQTILHDPPVLILDEPTDGLDPNQKHEVRELINAMAAEKIIIISTHILEEVDAVCTRAIIIAGGRIVADETPEALIHRSRYHNAVSIRLAHSADLAAVTEDLQQLAGVDHTEVDAHEYSVTAFPKPGAALLTVISELAGARRWPIENLRLEAGRLDEVFRNVTTQDAA
ncbi:MAG: ABC transporter ATP-binding protein [Gammaproteobacteria bacterium]|jgi:ABC-2 type transport system ATP-binding protein|nr:ABC transporter ATP-binding protein [Gammaproteobacteria bacterium]